MAHNAYMAANTPVDAGMGFLQQWVTPIASFMLAKKALSGLRTVEFEMKSGWGATWRTFGATAPTWGVLGEAGYRMGQGIGGAMAAPAGYMSKRLFGLSSGGEAALMGARVGGFLGGGLGMGASLFMAPEVLLAQGMTWGAQKTVFEPYMNRRRAEEAALSNYSDMYVAGDMGATTGVGLSAQGAYRLGKMVVQRGWQETEFSNNTVAQIAGMGMANGLFEGIGNLNPEAMDRRLKGILRSTKTAMRVLKMTEDSMQEVQAIMKQFADQGAMYGGVQEGIFTDIGVASMATGMSGMSVLQNAGRFGMTAAGMGMLGASGIRAGARAMAGVGSLYNQGGIAEPWVAMYGGVSGIANSAVSGAGKLYGSPLGMMGLYNQYLGGGQGAGALGTINAFAINAGRDPLHVSAQLFQQGRMMQSAAMMDQGTMGAYSNVIGMARMLSPTGKVSEDMLINVARSQGMGEDETFSMLQQIRAIQSGSARGAMAKQQEQDSNARALQRGYGGTGVEGIMKNAAARSSWGQAGSSAAGIATNTLYYGVLGTGIGAALGATVGGVAAGAFGLGTGGLGFAAVPTAIVGGAAWGASIGRGVGAAYGVYRGILNDMEDKGTAAFIADKWHEAQEWYSKGSLYHSNLRDATTEEQYRKKLTGDLFGVGYGATAEQNTLAAQISNAVSIGALTMEGIRSQKGYRVADENKALLIVADRIDQSGDLAEGSATKRRLVQARNNLARNPSEVNRKELLATISLVKDYVGGLKAFGMAGAAGTATHVGLDIHSNFRDAQAIGDIRSHALRATPEQLREDWQRAQAQIMAARRDEAAVSTVEALREATGNPAGHSPEEVMSLAAQVFAQAVDRFNGKAGKGEDGGTTAAPGGVLNAKTETVNPNRWLVSDYQVH